MSLQSQFLATMTIKVADSYFLEETPAGTRRIDILQGGTIEGPRIKGEILAGGSDLLLRRADGAMQPDVRLTIRTDDNALILVTYRGIRHATPEVMARIAAGEMVPDDSYYLRNTPYFETGAPRYAWLNRIVAVGIGRRLPDRAQYDIYEVL